MTRLLSGQSSSLLPQNNSITSRFEFLEIVIRASFGKYISSKQLSDSSDSVKRLLETDVLPKLPEEAAMNPNDFRREKFYAPRMERLIKNNLDLITAIFKLYKAKDKTKYFSIEHWIAFLESISLLGMHTGTSQSLQSFVGSKGSWILGIEKREAKLIFAWSQMIIIDELKKRHRAVSLMLFDFIEVLFRTSNLKAILCSTGSSKTC